MEQNREIQIISISKEIRKVSIQQKLELNY